MMIANLMNWTLGGVFMRSMGIMTKIPRPVLMPIVLLLTMTAIYVQETNMIAVWFTLGFGLLGYGMRILRISPLPFVIAFILGDKIEDSARQAFAATGGDPWFLFTNPIAAVFMALSVLVILGATRRKGQRA
jgi:putative tricarboxylic transport membrane protein